MRCSCTAELAPDAAFCGVCGRRQRSRRRSLTGTVLDARYRLDARLAAGGFATIYRATHLETGCEVALKVMHPDLAGTPGLSTRFRREGAALASLRDPHTVATYEIGETFDGTLYIAMELLRGESLHQRFLAAGALPWRQVLTVARAVCCSLAEAHALGIVHRDLKPANIHLEPHAGDPDFVKVLDFGVAKVAQGSGMDDGTELTRAGEAIGTIDYMAPEQLLGTGCDGRTDLYALGVVMYEMMTGRRPFADTTGPTGLMTALLTRTPAPPSTLIQAAPGLDRLILRCLERDPQHRFQTAAELIAAIDGLVETAEATALPTRRLWAGGSPSPISAASVPAPAAPDLAATWIDASPPGLEQLLAWEAQQAHAQSPQAPYAQAQHVAAAQHHADAMHRAQHQAQQGPAYPMLPYLHASADDAVRLDLPPPPAQRPLTPFDVQVVGTEVGAAPNERLGALRLTVWAGALLAAGLGLGALIALLS